MTGTGSCRTARLGLRVVLDLTHDPEDACIRADTSSVRPGHPAGNPAVPTDFYRDMKLRWKARRRLGK